MITSNWLADFPTRQSNKIHEILSNMLPTVAILAPQKSVNLFRMDGRHCLQIFLHKRKILTYVFGSQFFQMLDQIKRKLKSLATNSPNSVFVDIGRYQVRQDYNIVAKVYKNICKLIYGYIYISAIYGQSVRKGLTRCTSYS